MYLLVSRWRCSLASLPLIASHAVDAPLDLKWGQLMPPAEAVKPKAKTFFSGASPAPADGAGDGPAPPPLPEGGFMSIKRRQPGGDQPPRVVAELNGKRVRIGGYVVPLDFEATSIKEFLLVPFVGACIHVPPPPANQIVYVKSEKGFEVGRTVRPGLGDGHHEDRDGLHRACRRGLHASTPKASSLGPSDRSCFDDMPRNSAAAKSLLWALGRRRLPNQRDRMRLRLIAG